MMTRRLIILTVGALAFQSAAQTPSPNGRKAEWLQLRGDAAMSGRSPGIGHMVDGPPALGWRYDIAAWESYFSVDAHQAANGISLPFQAPLEPGYFQEHQRDWGIGIQENFQGGQAFYLHDGRAQTFEHTIGLHGGEGAASRSAFQALSDADKTRLVRFLRSL